MSEEEMNRFARGELSAEESRALAQRALDDPDLFDELTAMSVGRAGLVPRRRWRFGWRHLAVAVAAAVVVLAVMWPVLRRPAAPVKTTLAVVSEPTLLARHRNANAPVFRGTESEGRIPRSTGAVVSVDDGIASIDLGSVDGLAKGGEVAVVRDGKPIGTLTLTTVFRERARGSLSPGLTVRAGDQLRVPDTAFLGALLDEIDALAARGDSAGARRIAEQAAKLTADSAAADYSDINNLGVIAELRGDKGKAESLYRQALGAGPPDTARTSIEENLARVRGVK